MLTPGRSLIFIFRIFLLATIACMISFAGLATAAGLPRRVHHPFGYLQSAATSTHHAATRRPLATSSTRGHWHSGASSRIHAISIHTTHFRIARSRIRTYHRVRAAAHTAAMSGDGSNHFITLRAHSRRSISSPDVAIEPHRTRPWALVAGWDDNAEWRMAGANAGHTLCVTGKITVPLHRAWQKSALDLGAPSGGESYLHPRALAHGMLLVELDTPKKVCLVAVDAATGALKWGWAFPWPRAFPDGGLQPAILGESVYLYLAQGGSGAAGGWNFSRMNLLDGHVEWEVGPLQIEEAAQAPPTAQTLFRPVLAANSLLLVTPDFFGRPPLVAFDPKNGSVRWHSDSDGGDMPTVLNGGLEGDVALSADYAAGHPVLHSTVLATGAEGRAVAADAVGVGADWTEGVWDSEVRWADSTSHTCGVSVARLRTHDAWPAAACILSAPGEETRLNWPESTPSLINGPVLDGSLFVGQIFGANGKRSPSLWKFNLATGKTGWANHGASAGKPLLAAPGIVVGRGVHGDLVLWSADDGAVRWRSSQKGLTDCIAGDGALVAAFSPSILAAYW